MKKEDKGLPEITHEEFEAMIDDGATIIHDENHFNRSGVHVIRLEPAPIPLGKKNRPKRKKEEQYRLPL